MRRFLKETEVFDSTNVLHYIAEISQFHRIQGSKELPEAVRFIKEELRIWGVNAQLFEEFYDGKSWYLTLKSPIAWDLVYGKVELLGNTLTTSLSPLVVMAHSPGGKAEGEVVHIVREEDWEKAKEKIVLVGREWREAYRKANEAGARAFIAYREGTGDAIPYIGLFLTKDELEWARIPAVAISESLANRVINKLNSGETVKAKIEVETQINERQVLPILYAEIGKPPFILFTAHICHPKPGANDNASGSAMLIELARVLNGLYNDSFRFGFAFLWIPEYYGTQAFIEKYAKLDKYYAVINLDMVAGSEDRAGSTVMLVRTPASRFSIVSGVLEYFLELSNGARKSFSGSPMPRLKLKSYPYEMGSDHDVFNFFGIPSVMPITWPDRFYHSSEDTIDKVSKATIELIGKAVLATALALAKAEKEELQRFARGYAMKYLGELGRDRDTERIERLVMTGLARDSRFLGIESGHEFERRPWLRWVKKGRVSGELIKEADKEAYEEFKELTRDRKILVHLHELLMLGEFLPKEEAFEALEEEFGEVNREKLKKLVDVLEKTGVIELL
ncbi:Hypothetical leucine aminopeptidase [Thermococcus onnurineus NA1]|uniref:Hypothetical leucine aminopeptidase n=1 Tax=Thermococcus onnurineus (strain NA1) TaxID=523850 RepID=B6YW44_THEON|nr:DUF4910 domain-containing protein [Thermococcus onnurineus]ACJ17410.1 Hypothetical leucine aminopeptidase [Thermococcus onnurineus NA1]